MHMAEPRRRSFDEILNDAYVRWTKKFERALEEQRQVIGREAEQRSSDIDRATLEHLEALEQAVAARSAELEQAARQHRAAFDDAVIGRSKELDSVGSSQTEAIVKVATDAVQELEESATAAVRWIQEETAATRDDVQKSVAEGATAFEEFAEKRLGELEDTLRAKLEGFRRELIDETHQVRDATAEQLNETRSLVTSGTRRLEEQAATTQNEMRRVAAEETAAFDKLASERVAELQDALRSQTELLGEFTRMHESTSTQLDEVRAFTTETRDRLSKLDGAVARQIRANEESAATAAEGLKRVSAKELNSIQQRAIALDELARNHIAEIERAGGELLEAETSTAEGLRELERQLEERRAEIETLVRARIASLTQHVDQAEAAVVKRITELGAGAEDDAQALETRLARAADERTEELEASLRAAVEEQTRQLEATRVAVKDELRDGRRADASVTRATDARMTELLEMIAAAQTALKRVADRVEALEATAGAADRRKQRHRDSGPAPRERDGSQAPAVDGPARRRPTPDPPSTPDLRRDQ
jgi:hypothetical protein